MHRYWVQGLMYFWTHDPAVPPAIRAKHAAQGLCKDEWPSNGHFPTQLYVREAARMVGDKVFTYPMREVSLSTAAYRSCRSGGVLWIHFDLHPLSRRTAA